MNIVIEDNLLYSFGWEVSLLKAIMIYHYGYDARIRISELENQTEKYHIAITDIPKIISILASNGHVLVEESPLGMILVVPNQEINLSSETLRFLRHRGIELAMVRTLKLSYLQETMPENRSEMDFIRFALDQGIGKQGGSTVSWNPGNQVISTLTQKGISKEFVLLSVSDFLIRYDPKKGGADIEKNFITFMIKNWERQIKPLSKYWLPSSKDNQYLQSLGMSQREVLRFAFEFRVRMVETGRCTSDWSAEFIEYVKKTADLSISA